MSISWDSLEVGLATTVPFHEIHEMKTYEEVQHPKGADGF
jgi:hypothetical protein